MTQRAKTHEELAAWFMAKAAEAPPAANLILARHLQCRESRDLSNVVAEATRRYAGADRTLLVAPPDLLPPLA
ncbi:MAG: hypothetical protein ACLGSH_18270 [Acidobacteriota bacterium]